MRVLERGLVWLTVVAQTLLVLAVILDVLPIDPMVLTTFGVLLTSGLASLAGFLSATEAQPALEAAPRFDPHTHEWETATHLDGTPATWFCKEFGCEKVLYAEDYPSVKCPSCQGLTVPEMDGGSIIQRCPHCQTWVGRQDINPYRERGGLTPNAARLNYIEEGILSASINSPSDWRAIPAQYPTHVDELLDPLWKGNQQP